MITKPKGCYDVTGEVARKYQRICEVVSAYAKIYNYKYIRTPLFFCFLLLRNIPLRRMYWPSRPVF